MVSGLRQVVLDAADAFALAQFWSAVLDAPVSADDSPGDEEVLVEAPGTRLLFIEVPERKGVKNRVHLDLTPRDRRRDAEVERLLGLGASLVADHRRPDGTGWATLADPEGNEFCVERSDAERAGRAG